MRRRRGLTSLSRIVVLDLQKLIIQIQNVAAEETEEGGGESQVIAEAIKTFESASAGFGPWAAKLRNSRGQVFWPLAQPLESSLVMPCVSPYTQAHSVVACDGSQIMPTQHERFQCFLINIGEAVIHYETGETPVLESTPHLFHSRDDLYPLIDRRRAIIDESMVAAERGLLELATAGNTACELAGQGRKVLVLVDGGLVPFGLDRTSQTYRRSYMERLEQVLDSLDAAAVPVAGYVSRSRASELVSCLRVFQCPYSVSLCTTFCGHLNEDDFPCSSIWPVTDRQLLQAKLEPAERTCVFSSDSPWSQELNSRNRLVFLYLNTGQETARIEIPDWAFADSRIFEFAISAILSQCRKGMGYPVALAEAHNLAVVRQSDREQFFALLQRHLLQIGAVGVKVSPKELRKRRSIV